MGLDTQLKEETFKLSRWRLRVIAYRVGEHTHRVRETGGGLAALEDASLPFSQSALNPTFGFLVTPEKKTLQLPLLRLLHQSK